MKKHTCESYRELAEEFFSFKQRGHHKYGFVTVQEENVLLDLFTEFAEWLDTIDVD